MKRSTPRRPAPKPSSGATRSWRSKVRWSWCWPEAKCIALRTRHRKSSAWSSATTSPSVSTPRATRSRSACTLNFTFAIQSAVCRSRSPPMPSFRCGWSRYTLSPMRAWRCPPLLPLSPHKRRLVGCPHLLDDERIEILVGRAIAAQVARIEERRLHLQVPRREPAALAHVAHRGADLQPGVPQRRDDDLGHRLDVRVGLPGVE